MSTRGRKQVEYSKFWLLSLLFFWLVGIMPGLAEGAEKYPSRAINLIVPYAPGGASDLASKVLADKMAEFLGQPIISQYKPGGGGSLGAAVLVKSKPDGYTILVGSSTPLVLSPIVKKMDYRLEDFIVLGIYGETPIWVVVKKDAPWKTLKDFVAEAKASPGKITVSSYGKLTIADFCIELLSKEAGIKLTHVPYKATPEAISAVLGGHAQAAFTTGAGGLLESGTIRILAEAGDQRIKGLSDIPTFKEEGYPISITSSYTLCVPKGTPREVVDTLSNAQKKAYEKDSKEIGEATEKVEVWPCLLTPRETMERFKKDYAIYYKLAKELGVLAE
ncbi:MAG TPA: tripartite tricarboxylate transporter substrate binding protein [Thermodesulfobacteriota bacterium]|nr:tripartite tricarboxylate transporter substrate binding protein [Thermodesulfobacteriota bacterium]